MSENIVARYEYKRTALIGLIVVVSMLLCTWIVFRVFSVEYSPVLILVSAVATWLCHFFLVRHHSVRITREEIIVPARGGYEHIPWETITQVRCVGWCRWLLWSDLHIRHGDGKKTKVSGASLLFLAKSDQSKLLVNIVEALKAVGREDVIDEEILSTMRATIPGFV